MKRTLIISLFFIFCFSQVVNSAEKIVDNTLVEGILRDVIDQTSEKAKEVVRKNTGIDLKKRGYEHGKKHEPLPSGASDKMRRELDQLQKKHDRKIQKLEEELDRKLTKARNKFKREAAKEDKPEKIAKKRAKLEKKVNEAYAKFDKDISKENRKFDEKREKIIEKAKEKKEKAKGKKDKAKGKKEKGKKDGPVVDDQEAENDKGEKKGFFERWFGGSKKDKE